MGLKLKTAPLRKPMSTQNEAAYVDQMYAQWRDDPASVDQAWDKHFSGGSASMAATGDLG